MTNDILQRKMCPLLVSEMQSCCRQCAKSPVGKDQGRGVASPSMYGPSLAHSSRDLLSDQSRDQAFSGLQLPYCELCREVVLHKPPIFRPTFSLMHRSLLSASLWVRLPLAMRPHSPTLQLPQSSVLPTPTCLMSLPFSVFFFFSSFSTSMGISERFQVGTKEKPCIQFTKPPSSFPPFKQRHAPNSGINEKNEWTHQEAFVIQARRGWSVHTNSFCSLLGTRQ